MKHKKITKNIKKLDTSFFNECLQLGKQGLYERLEKKLLKLILNKNIKESWPYKLLGINYYIKKKYSLAKNNLIHYLNFFPDDHESLLCLSYITFENHSFKECLNYSSKAIMTKKDNYKAYILLANSYLKLKDFKAGLEVLEKAQKLFPDSIEIKNNLITLNDHAGNYDEAIFLAKNLFKKNKTNESLAVNLGSLYFNKGEFNKSLNYFNRSFRDEKVKNHSLFLKSQISFFQNRYDDFRDKYKSRMFSASENLNQLNKFPNYLDVRNISNKKILLFNEQGIGDEVFFSGFINFFINKYKTNLSIICSKRLEKIYKRSFSHKNILTINDAESLNEYHDFEMPIGSLIEHIKFENEDFFPQHEYLYPDEKNLKKWESRFAQLNNRIKIGISWKGGNSPKNENHVSISLIELMNTLPKNVDYISLQHGDTVNEIENSNKITKKKIYIWDDVNSLTCLEDLFSQISCLDLVITVNNSNLDFAGSLGTKTIGLMPPIPNFRFGLNSKKCMFYKNVHFLRKETAQTWESFSTEINMKINELVSI